jgi:hypothetical protein
MFCISQFCHQEKVALASYYLISHLKGSEHMYISIVIFSVSEPLINPANCDHFIHELVGHYYFTCHYVR